MGKLKEAFAFVTAFLIAHPKISSVVALALGGVIQEVTNWIDTITALQP